MNFFLLFLSEGILSFFLKNEDFSGSLLTLDGKKPMNDEKTLKHIINGGS